VDKTKYLYEILKEGGCQFLSLPRRFGKTLLISALEEILKGNEELFKGLWLTSSEADYDFNKTYPVVRLCMTGECNSESALKAVIKSELKSEARDNEVDISTLKFDDDNLSPILIDLVDTIYHREKKKVAILIDEYDAPIHGVIENIKQAEKNHTILHGFYSALKNLKDKNKHLLLFVTEVTKFVQASIFPSSIISSI
jgi:hypothetical protein